MAAIHENRMHSPLPADSHQSVEYNRLDDIKEPNLKQSLGEDLIELEKTSAKLIEDANKSLNQKYCCMKNRTLVKQARTRNTIAKIESLLREIRTEFNQMQEIRSVDEQQIRARMDEVNNALETITKEGPSKKLTRIGLAFIVGSTTVTLVNTIVGYSYITNNEEKNLVLLNIAAGALNAIGMIFITIG